MIPRRQFLGLLCAPAIVRVASLDALPRGVALSGDGINNWIRLHPGPHVDYFDNWLPLQKRIERQIIEAFYQDLSHIKLNAPAPSASDS